MLMRKSLLFILSFAWAAYAAAQVFPINFDIDATNTNSGSARYLRSIGIEGGETYAVSSNNKDKIYFDYTDKTFELWYKVGSFQPVVDYAGTWMYRYVYVDWNKDGKIGDGTDPGSELVASASCNGSTGKLNALGAVTIPEGTAPGEYIMRIKVDWNDTDPGGNTSQPVYENGGAIVDIKLVLLAEKPDVPIEIDAAASAFTQDISGLYAFNFTTTDRTKTYLWVPDVQLGGTTMTIQTRATTVSNYTYVNKFSVDQSFGIIAGQEYTPVLNTKYNNVVSANNMHKYLFIDLNRDGVYAAGAATAADDAELVSYNYYEGTNKLGETTSSDGSSALTAFTIPAGTPAGVYAMRWLVSQNCLDPTGSTTMGGKTLQALGGYGIDTRLCIRSNAKTTLSATNTYDAEGGNTTSSFGGSTIKLFRPTKSVKSAGATVTVGSDEFSNGDTEIDYGTAFDVRIEPESDEYRLESVVVKYGYNLDDAQYVSGLKQWDEVDLSSQLRDKGTTISVPAAVAASDEIRFTVTSMPAPVTGIDQIHNDSRTDNAIYDLQGRRVRKADKGIYIINGKKVLF